MPILVLVQGFSLEAATAKTSFVSDVCSRTMILYNGTHAANQYIFAVFTCLIFVEGFSIKSAHVSCRTCVQLLQNRYRQRFCILVQGLSIKAPMSQIKIIFTVFKFLILVQKVLMTGTPGYTT